MNMKKILTEGHRGYCARYPENTLVSFEAALDFGVDAIEFDIWLSLKRTATTTRSDFPYTSCTEFFSGVTVGSKCFLQKFKQHFPRFYQGERNDECQDQFRCPKVFGKFKFFGYYQIQDKSTYYGG